jgi:hypothetical protein
MSTGKELLEELRKDEELRRALAEELLPEALRHRELKKTLLIAISKEMATKEDIEKLRIWMEEKIESLRKATKEDIEGLRKATKEDIGGLRKDVEKLEVGLKSYVDARIDDLNRRIDDLHGVMKASLVAIVITLASTILVPLVLKIFF